jgi:hypothetical protein
LRGGSLALINDDEIAGARTHIVISKGIARSQQRITITSGRLIGRCATPAWDA